MKNTDYKNDINIRATDADHGEMSHKDRHTRGWKVVAIIAGSVFALAILLVVGVSLYLTPERVKTLIEKEGSKYLAADVRVGSFDYTLWRSLPNLHIYADSITITSRTLDGLSMEEIGHLPKDCRQLAAIGSLKGSVNLWKALRGDISLKGIEITAPTFNLVTVNDSVNNYNIFPKIKKDLKIPHISLNTVKVGAPVSVRWFDAQTGMTCDAAVDEAVLKILEGKSDRYNINLVGKIDFNSKEFTTVNSLPLVVSSDVGLGFSPMTVTINRCDVNIADISLKTQTSLIMSGKPTIGKMSLDLSCDDLISLTNYFSFREEDMLNGVGGTMPLYANLRLESPYELPGKESDFSSIPAFTLSVNIPRGEVSYPVDKKNYLQIRDIALQADLNIDPENPDASLLLVPMARFSSDGANVEASGRIADLMTGDPLLDVDIKCEADIAKTTRRLGLSRGVDMDGSLRGTTSLTCRLSEMKDKRLKDVNIKGAFDINSLRFSDKTMGIMAGLQNLSLKLKCAMPSMSVSRLGDIRLNLAFSSKGGTISSLGDSLNVEFKNIALTGKFRGNDAFSKPYLSGDMDVKAGALNTNTPGMRLNLNGIATSIKGAKRLFPWKAKHDYPTTTTSEGDSLISHRVRHTPICLTASLPRKAKTALSLLNIDADVRIKSGMLLADGYPVRNEFSDISLSTDLDTVVIRNLGASTRGATAQIKGEVKGLRNFLMSPVPATLSVDLDANFTDVDINRLSGNYYAGQARLTGERQDYKVAPEGAFTAADSLCVLIPRNLVGDLRLHSERAEYMGWQFSPLSTDITLHDGIAKIGDLRIGSAFGSVDIDWTYSTADLNDIFMKLDVGINDFDVAKFFDAFPMLTSSTPELENLSGTLSADVDGKLLMFPDMFVNAPSMTADVNIHTSDVEFKRDGKIKRITNLMLLRGDTPLELNDLDIHGSFHDNLLQVDPFMVDCGPYSVGVAGVNNLQGEMYYHIGLHKWPLHMPFGVNIVGHWPHPDIRFGGANIHDGREREISANLDDDVHVNIMRELKHGWLLFIATAAKYDAQNNQSYVFYVE